MKLYNAAGIVAKDRLRTIIEAEPLECSVENMTQMKKEVLEIVCRYFDFSPENYDIKIVLKNKKRVVND